MSHTYYLAQQSQPTTPTNPVIPWYNQTPTVGVLLLLAIFGPLFTYYLTKKASKDKLRREIFEEIRTKDMTINIDRALTQINNKLDENARSLQDFREEVNDRFEEVNDRFEEVNGRFDQERVEANARFRAITQGIPEAQKALDEVDQEFPHTKKTPPKK